MLTGGIRRFLVLTRINLVPVDELTDQHLFAEYRELPRILTNVRQLIDKGKSVDDINIPNVFTLGKGHMTFFYNKLVFLKRRHEELITELFDRGVYYLSIYDSINISEIPEGWCGDYEPEVRDIRLSRERLLDKIWLRTDFYRYKGISLRG